MELALQNIDIEELCIFHHLACRVVARCVRVPKATRGPPSPRLRRDSLRSPLPLRAKTGGKGIRTPDFQLAKLALYQLSYAPEKSPSRTGIRVGGTREIAISGEHASVPEGSRMGVSP